MSNNYAIIIHFMLPLTTFYRSGAHRSDVYKWDAFVTSWRFYNRAWQPQRHDRLPETSGTLWIHRRALTNQRCSLATGCGINYWTLSMDAIWSDDKVIGNLHTLYPMIYGCEATIAPHLDIRVSCMQNHGVYSKTTVWNPLVIILVSVFQKSQRRLYQSKARIRLYRCRFEIIQQMQQTMDIMLSASG